MTRRGSAERLRQLDREWQEAELGYEVVDYAWKLYVDSVATGRDDRSLREFVNGGGLT